MNDVILVSHLQLIKTSYPRPQQQPPGPRETCQIQHHRTDNDTTKHQREIHWRFSRNLRRSLPSFHPEEPDDSEEEEDHTPSDCRVNVSRMGRQRKVKVPTISWKQLEMIGRSTGCRRLSSLPVSEKTVDDQWYVHLLFTHLQP
jgi:hypothetical protein